jgi:hypothetical protein
MFQVTGLLIEAQLRLSERQLAKAGALLALAQDTLPRVAEGKPFPMAALTSISRLPIPLLPQVNEPFLLETPTRSVEGRPGHVLPGAARGSCREP